MNFIFWILCLFNQTIEFGQVTNLSLWRTNTNQCLQSCPLFELSTVASVKIDNLSYSFDNVTIEVFPFADLSDNIDGGNGYGYYIIYIGGSQIFPSTPGIISGVPEDGQFRKTNGSKPSFCCIHTGNKATLVVTREYFNSHLGLGGPGVNPDELLVNMVIPGGSNVPCAAIANNCSNMDDGWHRVEITFNPLSWLNMINCVNGPSSFISEQCSIHDYDLDNDIDLKDMSTFYNQ